MSHQLFEQNTEPEVRAKLNELDFEYKTIFSGYVFSIPKRRTRFVTIIEKIKVKHEQVKVWKQTTLQHE